MTAWLLVAHGSRDPRASQTIGQLTASVKCARPGTSIATAFLDHSQPRVDVALGELYRTGQRHVVVIPLLLAAAYHSDVDLPSVLQASVVRLPGLTVEQTPVLGPHPLLIAAAERRIRERGVWPGDPQVGVVLAAAGSSNAAAIRSINDAADRWGKNGWAAVVAGYASAVSPSVAAAVASLRERGIGRVVIAAYLLAPGHFSDLLYEAGSDAVTAPLGNAPEIVKLILERGQRGVHSEPAANNHISA